MNTISQHNKDNQHNINSNNSNCTSNTNTNNNSETKNDDQDDDDNVSDIDVDTAMREKRNRNLNPNTNNTTANTNTTTPTETTTTKQRDDSGMINNNNDSNDNNNNNNNSNCNLCLSTCITCQRPIYTSIVTPHNNDKEKQERQRNKNVNESNGYKSAPFARQCMHRECPIRKESNNTQCEECSQVSGCRGCNITLCEKCRNMLKVLRCGYYIDKENNKNENEHQNQNQNTNKNSMDTSRSTKEINDNNNSNKQNEKTIKEDNIIMINKNEKENENKNSNSNSDSNLNDENDDYFSCNSFICCHTCYKKIIFKYTILLKSNGFDSQEHISLIKLKKMFMKPYLSGLYNSLMLPQPQLYQRLVNQFITKDKNEIIVNGNDINWNTIDKNNWFPFHQCQGCKKYNCGCTEWVCCVNCRKYYCQQCEETILKKCKLDECGNYTCCKWKQWNRNCHYCNNLGNCQLLFCTKGHCDTHYIVYLEGNA